MPHKQISIVRSEKLKGLGVSPGKALGRVCLFEEGRHNKTPIFTITGEDEIQRELQRFVEAKHEAVEEINKLYTEVEAKIGKNEAAIFLAHRVILEDETISEKIEESIRRNNKNIEYCVVEVFNGYEDLIAMMDNEYMKERGTDFAELKRRLLDKLGNLNPGLSCQGEPYCTKGKGRIIVAEELTPSLTVEIDTEEVIGFVTGHGGATSHAAILANALGIPAVSGIHGIHTKVPCGTIMYIDGDNGEVWVDPPASEIETLETRQETDSETDESGEELDLGIKLLANVNSVEDADLSVLKNADGAGLVRTEYLFMESSSIPDEEKQYAFYSDIVKAFKGRTVTFRILDVGGDKPISYLNLEIENNPYLGWRGTRFLLDNPDIVHSQVRAIARSSEFGKVEIMYPMITDIEQLLKIKSVVRDAFKRGEWEKLCIREGAMVEVPSLVFQLEQVAQEIDFFSIGTNDLIQYIFAVDRTNENVAESYDPAHPVLWDIIEKTASIGKKYGKPVSVCGEMAGMPGFVGRFLKAGVTSLSMSPRKIPRVRQAIISEKVQETDS